MSLRCPLTYASIQPEEVYSQEGLRRLSPKLRRLQPLLFTAAELRQEVAKHADKLSIQGVKPKLSARLNVMRGYFDLVDRGGRFILKPPSADYPELPANEDVTMRLAAVVGIAVPVHGLIYGKDGELTYVIRRYDRAAKGAKVHAEDFSQLAGKSRDTKYESSMEQVSKIIDSYCTFPLLDRRELFVRTLFSYLCGNEDMHLKNFSVLTSNDVVRLTPAYDLLNTTIVLEGNNLEELALPLGGKKRKLTRQELIDYLGRERLQLNDATINAVLQSFRAAAPVWQDLLARSFLSATMRQRYTALLESRWAVLQP